MIYCKVVDGVIVARENKDNPTVKLIDGEPVWREVIPRGPAPSYDPATHHAPTPKTTIMPTQIIEGWNDPVAKTAQEIDAEKDDQANDIINGRFKVVLRLIFEIIKAQKSGNWSFFNSVTNAATFRDLVKSLL